MVSIPAETIVVPLASEADARETCTALEDHLDDGARVVVVHVVEKAGGAPDKVGVEQREEFAEEIFEIARECLETTDRTVETEVLYGTDVADTIFRAAHAEDAAMVVFSPREASRLSRFLSGDVALDLITDPELPVLVLPGPDDATDG